MCVDDKRNKNKHENYQETEYKIIRFILPLSRQQAVGSLCYSKPIKCRFYN